MTSVRVLLSLAALTTTTLATSGFAAPADPQSHPVSTHSVLLAQATPGGAGMGMGMSASQPPPTYAQQMKSMQEMHLKMLAAKTPEERNALMAAHMALMQNSMNMMGGMGGMGHMGHMGNAATTVKSGDHRARQQMMEERMDMMQSTMQLMMDRMEPIPVTK